MKDIGDRSQIVIVGGVACGPKSAAALARRLGDARIVLFQRDEHVSFATCGMPYFASGDVDSLAELTKTQYGRVRDVSFFEKSKNVTMITGAEVTEIDRGTKQVKVRRVADGSTFVHGYETLVLATGATPNKAPFEIPESDRVRPFTRPSDAAHFRQLAQTGQVGRVVIIGGGFIGCELAEAAAGLWGMETVLIEKEPQLLPYVLDPEMAYMASREMEHQDVRVLTGEAVERVTADGDNLFVHVAGRDPFETDYVFLCLGVTPNVSLAEECGLATGESGGIAVDRHMATSDPNIYAGGDCVESEHLLTGKKLVLPMGSLANRHGRVIAENIAGHESRFPGVLGAFLVKVFDLNVGSVGLSEQAAHAAGLTATSVWASFPDKPDYYPESTTITLKMVYNHETLELYGLQAAGLGDVCRRVDVFSSFLQRRASVEDLLDFEHGYAPPYSEALDPLFHLASLAIAARRGLDVVSPSTVLQYDGGNDTTWLDVREPVETEALPWPIPENSGPLVKIPLDDLRSRLGELDKNRRIMILCARGPRSFQAAATLRHAGFENVHLVGGGITALHPTKGGPG